MARRITSLEDDLGEKLVERRPDGYMLTPAGETALEAAAEMEAAAQALSRQSATDDDRMRGLVRVNAPPALAQGFLLARLAELTVAYPGLDVDLATDLRSISLNRHKADIAVRVGKPADADLIAKQVGSMAFGFYGTAARCDAVERGESPTFVNFNEESGNMPEAMWLSRQFPRARIGFRAENQVLLAIAAIHDAARRAELLVDAGLVHELRFLRTRRGRHREDAGGTPGRDRLAAGQPAHVVHADADRAEATRIGNGRGHRRRGDTRHRRLNDGMQQFKSLEEGIGSRHVHPVARRPGHPICRIASRAKICSGEPALQRSRGRTGGSLRRRCSCMRSKRHWVRHIPLESVSSSGVSHRSTGTVREIRLR